MIIINFKVNRKQSLLFKDIYKLNIIINVFMCLRLRGVLLFKRKHCTVRPGTLRQKADQYACRADKICNISTVP